MTPDHKLAVSVSEAREIIGLGLTKMYDLMNEGEFETFKVGRATRITTASIKAYVGRQVTAERERREAERHAESLAQAADSIAKEERL